MIENYDSVDVFIGVDVGKGEHHAVALDRAGKQLFDKALPNDEAKLRELIGQLKRHGQVLFVVDQPATIGALPIAVAQAEDVLVGYLPGLAMRRIADLHAGEAKTDARGAAIIAQAARSLPHALRSLQLADEQVAELSMLCGFDDDVVGQITATSNRIRGLLTQIHPALERVLGPKLAEQLAALRRQRDEIAVEVERLVEAHSLHPVLISMPGVGIRTAARLLTEVSGKDSATAGHLAAYAGLAPVTRRSGSSIRGEHPSRRGNKILKRALFLSAFAALRDPVSRAYYDRKIDQGKRHNQALIALARRRCDVLYAMLRDGTLYQTDHQLAA
ncbi:IS110 family transposase [Cryobacterium sp. TMT2-18-3]|uniref:IS110 family transposase n=1 Tax=unclassified Cryobacterium TaxID=2649013 RepID=UPI00106C89EE|nr:MULTISPECIES: IS110 family transposase [unclassified Cryobacterium]TFC30323.1 IS110 family transposase [Cryobacterium sp. TMT2-18-2]TFC33070.1 IS110 family transposase [Cryobacterium sp. TMT2-42-4]TFC66782.1 IS110 family transposase [Cryobacterium sp. TMT2-18-3]